MTPQDQQQQSPIQAVGGDTVREQDKIHLVLAYVGIFCLIPLLTVKDSPYVKWHAKQGLAMCLGWIAMSIVLAIVAMIPVVGWILSCLAPIAGLVLMIMAISKALKGERWRIPVLADLSEKF